MISTHIIPPLLAVALAGPFAWMAFDRDPCSAVTSEVGTPTVAIGDSFHASFVIDRKEEGCRVVVTQRIFYGSGATAAEIPFADMVIPSPGPHGADIWPVTLPIAAAVPGPARYRAAIFYYKNPLQEWLNWPVSVSPPDLHFTIEPKES